MAQPIYCDFPGCQDPEAPRARTALWMLQKLDGTTIEAYCGDHWPMAAVVSAQEQAEANGTSLAELLAPMPPGPDEPTDDDEPGGGELASFQQVAGPAEPAQATPALASEDQDTPEPPAPAVEAASGPTVVRRGTSRSRRAHEARKRDKARAAVAAETDPGDGSTGP